MWSDWPGQAGRVRGQIGRVRLAGSGWSLPPLLPGYPSLPSPLYPYAAGATARAAGKGRGAREIGKIRVELTLAGLYYSWFILVNGPARDQVRAARS